MKINEFRTLSAQLHYSQNWFGKFGREFRGGGGGVGHLASQHNDKIMLTIYHQASDGATNYHEIPMEFVPYMMKSIRKNFEAIAKEAIEMMEADLKKAAEEARAEYAGLMEAAGITVPVIP